MSHETSGSEEHHESPGDAIDSTDNQQKLAFFVSGLEHSISSADAYPPILSSFKLKRELFRQQVPHPLALWLPDYALTALARKAPDFWAWRSGLYEFAPEREIANQSITQINNEALHLTLSLSERGKRERLVMLKGLLADYRELGGGSYELSVQAGILNDIGIVHQKLGELVEAKQAYEEALNLAQKIGSRFGEAVSLHQLGMIAQFDGDYIEARRFYQESLKISREIENKFGMSVSLNQLGILAHLVGDYDEARRLSEMSLEIKRELGDRSGIAGSIHQLGRVAHETHNYADARRFYEESLMITRELGDKSGIAIVLHNMGLLAQDTGDYAAARGLYAESLDLERELGNKSGVATSLVQLALLDAREGNLEKGIESIKQAEEIIIHLRNEEAIRRVREQRRRMEEKATAKSRQS
ncbi:MAG: tetratricopeptide repeat protein [Acidobacteriota bacterium]|nr:tetratricopeptide repeat protein [Acidobacteriota bacterium]